MDRVSKLKRSASKKAHDEQEEGKKDPSLMKTAKEAQPHEVEECSTANFDVVDDAGASGEWSECPLHESPISELSFATDVPISMVTSDTQACKETEKSRSVQQSLDEASSSDPVRDIPLWDARKSAERFARLRKEILRRHFSHEIYPVISFQGNDVKRTASGPVILYSNQSNEPQKKEVADENSSYQRQKEGQKREAEPAYVFTAAREAEEFEPSFVFTAENEWGTEGSKLTLGFSSRSLGRENDKTSVPGSRSKITRQDTPYKIRKTSRSRIGGKATGKLFQRKTSDCFGYPRTMLSHSLENLLTAESPVGTPEKAKSECVQILRNIRACQKVREEARKLTRHDSAAERAHFTAELQAIARGCSITSCNSPARESWESVKNFLSNLFCCRCFLSDRKADPASPSETGASLEEEVTSGYSIERETAETETMFAVERLVSLPAFPNVDKRQRSNNREQRSVSCGFELEKAMEARMLQKTHSD